MASRYPPLYGQYTSPLQQLLNQPSKQPFVIAQPEDPRSNLEKFIEKFYPNILNDQFQTDLKSQLEESRSQNGSTDFSKISLGNLKFLKEKFLNPPQFDYTPPQLTQTLLYVPQYGTFKQQFYDEILLKEEKEKVKQLLTYKLLNSLPTAIDKKLEDFRKIENAEKEEKLADSRKIENADDLLVAIIQPDQTKSPQEPTTLEFSSKANEQISEFLNGDPKRGEFANDPEIQEFYFKELKSAKERIATKNEIIRDRFKKDSEDQERMQQQELKNKAKSTLKTNLATLTLNNINQKLSNYRNQSHDSKKLENQISDIFKSDPEIQNLADDLEIQVFYLKQLTNIQQKLEQDQQKQQELKQKAIKDSPLKSGNSSLEKSSSFSPFTKISSFFLTTASSTKKTINQDQIDKKFKDFFKPTAIEKIKSAGLWFIEFIRTRDFSSPPQDYDIYVPATKAYKQLAPEFDRKPKQATNFASFLSREFNREKNTNKSLTFEEFIEGQSFNTLLTEFDRQSKEHAGPPQAISATRRTKSLGSLSKSDENPRSVTVRSRSFLTPGQSNPNDTLIQDLLNEYKVNFKTMVTSYGRSSTRQTFTQLSFIDLTSNQQKIVEIYHNFKKSMEQYDLNKVTDVNAIKPEQHITEALTRLNDVLTKQVSSRADRVKDLDFASALYNIISETKGFDHRKDYGNDGLHGQIQQKLGITVLAPARPPSRSR